MTATESTTAVSIERALPAPRETVFRALTDPALFARWMGPEGSAVTVDELDARVGGRIAFRVQLANDGPTFALHGSYEEVEPPSRLVHSWAVEGDDATTTVAFELVPDGDATLLRLTHTGFLDETTADRNDAGWRHQLDRLEALVADPS